MAFVYPVRLLDDLTHGGDESVEGTHTVLLLGTPTNTGERDYAVVDDDPDLVAVKASAG